MTSLSYLYQNKSFIKMMTKKFKVGDKIEWKSFFSIPREHATIHKGVVAKIIEENSELLLEDGKKVRAECSQRIEE